MLNTILTTCLFTMAVAAPIAKPEAQGYGTYTGYPTSYAGYGAYDGSAPAPGPAYPSYGDYAGAGAAPAPAAPAPAQGADLAEYPSYGSYDGAGSGPGAGLASYPSYGTY